MYCLAVTRMVQTSSRRTVRRECSLKTTLSTRTDSSCSRHLIGANRSSMVITACSFVLEFAETKHNRKNSNGRIVKENVCSVDSRNLSRKYFSVHSCMYAYIHDCETQNQIKEKKKKKLYKSESALRRNFVRTKIDLQVSEIKNDVKMTAGELSSSRKSSSNDAKKCSIRLIGPRLSIERTRKSCERNVLPYNFYSLDERNGREEGKVRRTRRQRGPSHF